jgi:hypothetical protein
VGRDATRDRVRRPLAQEVPFDIGVAQEGTVEVVDFSEQDGSLFCIAQLRATLTPAP